MNEYQTGAVRDTGGKGRMDLLPWCALIRVSRHMEDAILPDPETGMPHYPERNWEKGLPIHSMVDSAFRHLAKYAEGWDDEDHLCAAATNLLMAMWMEEHRPEMQDIPSRTHGNTSSLRSDDVSVVSPAYEDEAQEKAKEERPVAKAVCRYYREWDGACMGDLETAKCQYNGQPYACENDIL